MASSIGVILQPCRRPFMSGGVMRGTKFLYLYWVLAVLGGRVFGAEAVGADAKPPAELATYFVVPEQYGGDLGNFRSPLVFEDGTRVARATDWPRRRREILANWQRIMGPWP